jgi:protease-4
VAGCEGRAPQTDAKGEKKVEKRHSGPKVAVLDLSSGAPEEADGGFLGLPQKHRSFGELISALDDIEGDKDVRGVMVRFGSGAIGIARSEEIGERLSKIREKTPVHCHADGYTNATFLAASRGCSKIFISPSGEVEAIGIAAQLIYLRKLLADELKVDIDFLQVGKFKGAEEPLTRDGPSPEARESLESVLRDIRALWLTGIKAGRPRPGIEDAVEDGPYGSSKAKALGLVDDVKYSDDAATALRDEVKAVRDETFFGRGAQADRPEDLDEMVRILAGTGDENGPVALVRASGSISMEGGGSLGGSSGISDKELSPIIARLEKDDDVKAVVLRIDSPGGSALASDLMWHRLMKLRARKPLVVSVGDMAASGGYYLASTADVIFADPTSIVGSIGVVGGKLGIGGALGRFGVHAETFPASPKPGAATRAAYMSAFTPWDEPTRARILESMTEIYELFLSRVAEGRKIPVETVAASAEGRIFSGRQGKERKLVDELGGLTAAIAKARELAKLPKDAHVAVIGGKKGFFGGGGGDGAEERVNGAARSVTEPRVYVEREAARRLAPGLVPFAENLLQLGAGERTLTAMPFALEVR